MVRPLLWTLAALLVSAPALAQKPILLTEVKAGQVRIDGELSEWRGLQFEQLGADEDASLEYAFGHDDKGLYFAARVQDDHFVRSPRPYVREDAIIITLALPRASGRFTVRELWLWAGIPGKQAAQLGVSVGKGRPKPVKASQIVEGPLGDGQGYVLEAYVPWAGIGGARDWPLGRGSVRLRDVDRRGGAVEAEPRLARLDPKHPERLPPLMTEGGAIDSYRRFLADRGMPGRTPRHDLIGDVSGGPRLERVVVVGSFLIVMGPEVQGGAGFRYVDLPVRSDKDVKEARLQALLGNRKRQLVLRLAQKNELGSREVVQIKDLGPNTPRQVFAVEVRKQTGEGFVESKLELEPGKRRKPARIRVRLGDSEGLGPHNYREGASQGVEAILLPWGPATERVYGLEGDRFVLHEETENPDHVPAAAATVASAGVAASASAAPVQRVASKPKPPGTDALVAHYRKQRGIARSLKASFVRHVNLAEDGRNESVMLFGKELLVLGKGFQGGTGFFYFSLPVADPDHVQRLFTGDVTGDGRREIFVRIKQMIGDVQREILLAYSFHEGDFRRILAVEVRRAQGRNSVGNAVRLIPSGGHWVLRIYPGGSTGWAQASYPFVTDSGDGFGPLLLPWQARTANYRYKNAQLIRAD